MKIPKLILNPLISKVQTKGAFVKMLMLFELNTPICYIEIES